MPPRKQPGLQGLSVQAIHARMRTFRCELEVRGYELDSYRHVNHGVYLNYFEHARWLMLREVGVTPETFEAWKTWPVVAGIEVNYLKPTFLGDRLSAETRAIEKTPTTFTVEQRLLKDGAPVTTARVRIVMVNERGRPTAMPADFSNLWEIPPNESRI